MLSYYSDPANLYFPHGNIDLKTAISADSTDGDHEGNTAFSVTVGERLHLFKADSHSNAREWVKRLQKAIFRCHNDSDSVKISLPTDNILDIESNPVLESADTCRVRIIDNDETFAIDEVCHLPR